MVHPIFFRQSVHDTTTIQEEDTYEKYNLAILVRCSKDADCSIETETSVLHGSILSIAKDLPLQATVKIEKMICPRMYIGRKRHAFA